MKHYLSLAKAIAIAIALASAIKRGILRIFPKSEGIFLKISVWISSLAKEFMVSIVEPIPSKLLPKATYWSEFWLGLLFLILVGCSSTRQMTTQLVRNVERDTIYLNKLQYDSIYIYQERNVLPLPDSIHLPFNGEDGRGLYIKDKSIEYRYKLLRDTIKVIQRDSIPYEVVRIETKEITRPLTLFDHLCRYSFFFLLGIFLYLAYIKIRQIKKGCF